MNERVGPWPWMIWGTVLLVGLSALLFPLDTYGLPWPIHQVLMHWILPYSFLFVVPLLFWGTFGFLWNSRWFGVVTLAVVALIGALDTRWFVANWDLAYDYDGRAATLTLAVLNVVGIGVAFVVSAVGLLKGARKLTAIGYFLSFAVLVVCAFPLFGPTS